jgi:cell division protein FtsI (penicillin-binding protein 3)
MTRPLRRLQLITVLLVLVLVGLGARAAQIQIVEGAKHAATSQANRTERKELAARRGAVLDRRETVLADDQLMYAVGVAPNELRDPEADARLLATQLGEPVARVKRRLRQRWVEFGVHTSSAVQPLRAVRGVHLEPRWRRRYPLGSLARGLLGRGPTGDRTATGLEAVWDTLLTGVPGEAVVLKDRTGREYESPARLGAVPQPGDDVLLTLDADLQEIAERALDNAMVQFQAEGGDIVIVAPTTGEILAIAWEGPNQASPIAAPFEPGSTAKLFAAAALVAMGKVRATDSVWTEGGKLELEYRTVTDDHPAGWLTLPGVIQHSSNIGIVKLAARLAPEEQFHYLRAFGLGTYTGVDFPVEARGSVPRPDQWSGTTAASLAMGYEISATALQLAMAYAAIANDGVLLQPTLLKEVRAPDGKVRYRHTPRPVRQVVSPTVAHALRDMLRAVVYPGGTGETAALFSYEVAGKTGTARRAGPGGYILGSYTSTFVSMFPAEDPQLVMVIKLDDPEGAYARLTAAPVTRSVLQQLLATRSSVLDRTRLSTERAQSAEVIAPSDRSTLWVTEWPRTTAPGSPQLRAVPDVEGLTVRAAARAMHDAGLRVQLRGWGTVQATEPTADSEVPSGTLIHVSAERRSHE